MGVDVFRLVPDGRWGSYKRGKREMVGWGGKKKFLAGGVLPNCTNLSNLTLPIEFKIADVIRDREK